MFLYIPSLPSRRKPSYTTISSPRLPFSTYLTNFLKTQYRQWLQYPRASSQEAYARYASRSRDSHPSASGAQHPPSTQRASFHQQRRISKNFATTCGNSHVGTLYPDIQDLADCGLEREIPEDVAHKTDQGNEFPNEMWKKLGEAGFLGMTADEEYGGLAMGYQAHCVVMEEISRASGG